MSQAPLSQIREMETWRWIKCLTSELLKAASTSSTFTSSSCWKHVGWYPFLNHPSSKISGIVIRCTKTIDNQMHALNKWMDMVKDFRWIDEFQTRTKVWELTVTGLGSRIRFISFFAPGDNHDGHEKSALQIWNLGRLCINVLDDILTIRKEEIELRST